MSPTSQTFEFEKQVREACKHYNKPERIGKLPIASLGLQAILLQVPTHPTNLVGRGKALQAVIRENLHKLEPQETHSREWEIYLCLSLYIYQYDYLRIKKIKNVRTYLDTVYQIPHATFNYRIRKEGIPQLSYLISSYLSQKLTWIEPIPQIVNFIGREYELIYYHQQLEQNKIAVIEGVGGIGKTALAAQLASSIKSQDQCAVCWVTLRAGLNDSSMALLYAWGVFFAQHDYPQLWAFMRATATEEKRWPEYYPILRAGFAQVKPLLCIDNLEVLPRSEDGFWELLSIVQQEASVSLLLISQQRPKLSSLDHYNLLSGLPKDKVRDFLIQREIELTDDQLDHVANYTNGNLRLLDLWSTYVKQQAVDVPTSLERLLNSAATDAFLTSEIIGGLTTGQKQATKLLAFSRLPLDSFILQKPPRHLAPLSDLDIEDRDFERLQRLQLIQQQPGKQWAISPLLKDYLNSIENEANDAVDLHEWLANLYLSQSNIIESAYHLIKADEVEEAILLLVKQKQTLIEQGQASAIYNLVKHIQSKNLDTSIRQILRQFRIELLQLFGDYDLAEKEAYLEQNEAITIESQASSMRYLGEIARLRGKPVEADNYYQEALRLLATKEIVLEASLHRDRAWILTEENNLDKAWNEAQQAQMALNTIFGDIAQRRGDLHLALNHYQKAIKICEEHGGKYKLLRVRNNLAILYWQQNKIEQALPIYEKNLETIGEIGELVGKAITLLNLGLGYAELGKFNRAIEYTKEAFSIFNDLGDARGKMFANQNLAEQYLQLSQLDQAQKYAKEIIDVDETLKTTREYAEGLRIHAEVLLTQGKVLSALEQAQQGLDILRKPNTVDEFTDPFFAKQICKTLARIHTALGNTAKAEKYDALAKVLAEKLKS